VLRSGGEASGLCWRVRWWRAVGHGVRRAGRSVDGLSHLLLRAAVSNFGAGNRIKISMLISKEKNNRLIKGKRVLDAL
jgi:hypothetical protein